MSIRTLEQLNDRLSNELAWRKRELSEIKGLVQAKNVSDQRHRALLRSGVCILYSHWEGFVKLATEAYLDYINSQKLTYQQLASNFLALAMKKKLEQTKETNKPSLYIPICDFFLSELNQRCVLPKDMISTASNLSSENFKGITEIIGIDFSFYSTKSRLIDTTLLKTRNQIAHGHYLVLDREEYIELQTEIINMLDTFRNQIENAAVNQEYIASS
ncbi:MAG: MAE_28990/MAE_18760 family HEPN-like nuclease [Halothece sp.]